jgi:hypothetical protein
MPRWTGTTIRRESRCLVAALGLVVWAGFGLSGLITWALVPVPPALAVTAVTLTIGEAYAIARVIWRLP